jgi:hypothetical protein
MEREVLQESILIYAYIRVRVSVRVRVRVKAIVQFTKIKARFG